MSDPYHAKLSSPVKSGAIWLHELASSSYTRTTPKSSNPCDGAATANILPSFESPTFFPNPSSWPSPRRSSPTLSQLVVDALYSRTRTRPPNGAPSVPSADGAPIATLLPSKEIETDSAENWNAASPCKSTSSPPSNPQPQPTGLGGGGNGGGGAAGDGDGGGNGGGDDSVTDVHDSSPQHVHSGFGSQHSLFVPTAPPTSHVSDAVSVFPAPHPTPIPSATQPVHAHAVFRVPPASSTHPL